jgi:hypothetical protein
MIMIFLDLLRSARRPVGPRPRDMLIIPRDRSAVFLALPSTGAWLRRGGCAAFHTRAFGRVRFASL